MFKFKHSLKYTAILLTSIFLHVSAFADITTLTEPGLDTDIDKTIQQLNTQLNSSNKNTT